VDCACILMCCSASAEYEEKCLFREVCSDHAKTSRSLNTPVNLGMSCSPSPTNPRLGMGLIVHALKTWLSGKD
jgi:hypothetical protein